VLEKAIKWARKKHDGSWRDGPSPLPYVTHPIEVLSILRYEAGVEDPDALVAAALHDVIEDTDATLDDVERKFGQGAASLVEELTRTEPTDEEVAGLSAAKVRDLRSNLLLADIAKMSKMAKVIKLCDRLSNLRNSRVTRPPDALRRYLEQTDRILEIVPRKVSPNVWDAVKALAEQVAREVA